MATYYISTTGNDANVGTSIGAPWRTIAKAAATLQADDVGLVRSGTYTEHDINFTNSGTSGHVITLKNYPGDTPIIDGGYTSAAGHHPVFGIEGVSYITLDGLSITRGSVGTIYLAYNAAVSNITIQNCDISNVYVSDNSGNIYIDSSGADNITITNNYIHGFQATTTTIGSGIVIFQAQTVTITNNTFYSLPSGIIYKHSFDDGRVTTVRNNYFYDINHSGMIWTRSDGVITNNVFRNVGRQGIQLFEEAGAASVIATKRNVLTHNTLVDTVVGLRLEYGAGTAMGAQDTTIRDNLIYNFNDTEFRGISVWLYDSPANTSNTTVSTTLIYSSSLGSPIAVRGAYYTVAAMPLTGSGNVASAPTFTNYAAHILTLTSASAGHNAASDGTDMGANIALVGVGNGASAIDTTAPAPPSGVSIN